MIRLCAFFGDRKRDFALTDPMIAELERVTDTGIGTLYQRLTRMQFKADDLAQILRLGLIGGGTSPQEAAQLVETYAHNRPLAETYPIALDVLDARWNGIEEQPA